MTQPIRIPDAPSPPSLLNVTNTTVQTDYEFNGSDGGSAVQQWQIGYGLDPETPSSFQDGIKMTITGLTPGRWYYFWSRARNAVGWGLWSGRSATKTQTTPMAPTGLSLYNPKSTTVEFAIVPGSSNGQPVTGYQIGYSKGSVAPDAYYDFFSFGGVVPNLEPGTLYTFWARGKNVYGWGDLSEPKTARTLAGAWVNVNGVWTAAVPYVNVAGVWKPARVWAKIAGVWKETE